MDQKLFNYSKNPIPVLNPSTPHNYAIMSALLSHMDSNVDHLSSHSNHIKSTHQSSHKMNRNALTEKPIKHTNNHSSRTASKDQVYTSKKQKTCPTNVNQQLLVNKNAHLNKPENVNNQSNLFYDSSNTSFENPSSDDRPFASTYLNESSSFLTDSTSNTIENEIELNEADESQTNGQNSILAWSEHNYNENNSANQSESNKASNENPVITYTISCPSDWNLNLDRMINCYCLLDKNFDKMTNSTSDKIKLKCGVCELEFPSLNKLVEHKESNAKCVNDLRNVSSTKVFKKFWNNPEQLEKYQEEMDDDKLEEFFRENDVDFENDEDDDEDDCNVDSEIDLDELEGDNEDEQSFSDNNESLSNTNEKEILIETSLKSSDTQNENKTAKNCNKVKKKSNKNVNSRNKKIKDNSQSSAIESQDQSDLVQKQKPRRKYVKRKTVANVNLICQSKS